MGSYGQPQRKESVVSFENSFSEDGSNVAVLPTKHTGRSVSTCSSGMDLAEMRYQLIKLKFYFKLAMLFLIPLTLCLVGCVVYLMINLHMGVREADNRTPDTPRSEAQRLQSSKDERFCMWCKTLRLPSQYENSELNKLVVKSLNQEDKCCATGPEQTDLMMQRFFEVMIQEQRANGKLCTATSFGPGTLGMRRSSSEPSSASATARCTNDANPSAHLIGSTNLGSEEPDASAAKILTRWSDDSDIAYRNSVTFDKKLGRLIVPKDGFYYVYSQVHFIQSFPRVAAVQEPGTGGANDRRPNTNSLNHSIKRYHVNYFGEEVLMQKRQSQCWVTNKLYSEYTSYLGGILHLRSGDEIYIGVSNKTMVSSRPKLNYFGMFFVSPTATK